MQRFDGSFRDYTEQQKKMERIDQREEERLLLETRLASVLSRLSLEPSEELEREFQALLAEKRRLAHASQRTDGVLGSRQASAGCAMSRVTTHVLFDDRRRYTSSRH